MGVNGILNVNKPAGCTSFSIISRLRRLTGVKRIGHAGTLDPLATGVLPVCIGSATRIIEYMLAGSKEYICGIELGCITDSYDAEGQITERRDFSHVTLPDVERSLADFLGDIRQAPPAYSALKINGTPHYKLARAGRPQQPETRTVHISSLEITSFTLPYIQLKVRCGRGAYMRSLAHDLGLALGCGAYLKDLVRSAYGPFSISEATAPDTLEKAGLEDLTTYLYQADFPLLDWPACTLTDIQSRDVTCGKDMLITCATGRDTSYCRAYNAAGRFIAVLRYEQSTGLWHPDKVLA